MKNFESFESNRWIWRVNLAGQVALMLALVGIVNFLGMTVWTRHDLTENRTYSLSEETAEYIRRLEKPVTVIVTLTEDPTDREREQVYRDVRGMLREFEYAARNNAQHRIRTIFLNIYEERARAELLGVPDLAELIIFQEGEDATGTRRTVQVGDLYDFAQNDRDETERRQFLGERVFARAMLDVSSSQPPVLYFLTGHGEMNLDDVSPGRGTSYLNGELQARAYETRPLDLTTTRKVPEDASMVIVLGPQTPLLRAEEEMLDHYLRARAGRVLLALDPGYKHGLDSLLQEWGILVDDVVVHETDPGGLSATRELLIKSLSRDHPITRTLALAQIRVVMGSARTARPDLGRKLDETLIVSELLQTSAASWGESNYRDPTWQFDPRLDVRGPLFVGTVAERRTANVSIPGGRLIVLGTADFVANSRLNKSGGNFGLFYNSITWALDPENRLPIAPRPVARLKLTFSESQLAVTRFAITVGPALAFALLGLLVHFSRRR